MKQIYLLILLFSITVQAQYSARELYAENVGNYKPGSQLSLLVGKNSWEIGYSYTDIFTWGASFERTQDDRVNDQKPFYALYGSVGAEFGRITVTIKSGAVKLQQMGSDEQTIHFTYGGSLEYRIIPNLGIVVGSDVTVDNILLGINIHLGDKN